MEGIEPSVLPWRICEGLFTKGCSQKFAVALVYVGAGVSDRPGTVSAPNAKKV